jgi:hypothetical protein
MLGPCLLAPCLLGTSSCGYTFGTGLHQQGVRTVALAVVGNESYRQRLEVELSAALARELPVSTDLQFCARDHADATLQVVITDVRERTLVPGNRTAPVREGALESAVRMRLVRRNGEVLLDRVLLDRTEFRDPIGEDLTNARGEVVADLARKIALALESGF